jgi:hypothetical protein
VVTLLGQESPLDSCLFFPYFRMPCVAGGLFVSL